jgi:hypothetical protein
LKEVFTSTGHPVSSLKVVGGFNWSVQHH